MRGIYQACAPEGSWHWRRQTLEDVQAGVWRRTQRWLQPLLRHYREVQPEGAQEEAPRQDNGLRSWPAHVSKPGKGAYSPASQPIVGKRHYLYGHLSQCPDRRI